MQRRFAPLRVVQRFVTGPEPCIYLPDRFSSLEYLVVSRLTPEEYERRMNAGWRKFGPMLFHPVCADCNECRPIRIPVAEFTPNRSQQRAQRRNADLTVRFSPPSVDASRLNLYNRYHVAQSVRKGWPADTRTVDEYTFSFVNSPVPIVEISVWEETVLRAVVITEITPNVVSGVYHYHEPAWGDRSLGKFAMLQTLELAKQLGKPYAYFGYYVAGSESMTYKATFRPCEILTPDNQWVRL